MTASWGAVILTGIASVIVPFVIAVIVSYPVFGVGVAVGISLRYVRRRVRHIGRFAAEKYLPGGSTRDNVGS